MKIRSFLTGYLSGMLLGIITGIYLLVDASTAPKISLNNFAFVDLQGHSIDTSKFKGKAVIINIWATWCPPCLKEMPSIENAVRILKYNNVIFLIASDEAIEKIIKFKEKRKFNLPFFNFSIKGDPSLLVEGRPQTYIFNASGELVYNRLGAFEWDDEKILLRLRSFIK